VDFGGGGMGNIYVLLEFTEFTAVSTTSFLVRGESREILRSDVPEEYFDGEL
jgi:hypothetical protein